METLAEKHSILNESLDRVAQEAHHLLLVFKRHIAFEFEKEQQKIALNSPEMVSQRSMVLDAMLSQWTIIHTLCVLIAENTPGFKFEALEKQMEDIEKILEVLNMKKSPFKEHEYHFPFHVLKLLSNLKTSVKQHVASMGEKSTADAIENVALPSKKDVIGLAGARKHVEEKQSVALSGKMANAGGKINVKDAKKHFETIGNVIAESASNMKRKPVAKVAQDKKTPESDVKVTDLTSDSDTKLDEKPESQSLSNDQVNAEPLASNDQINVDQLSKEDDDIPDVILNQPSTEELGNMQTYLAVSTPELKAQIAASNTISNMQNVDSEKVDEPVNVEEAAKEEPEKNFEEAPQDDVPEIKPSARMSRIVSMTGKASLADLKLMNSQISKRHESIRQSMRLGESGLLQSLITTFTTLESPDLLVQTALSPREPIQEDEPDEEREIHEMHPKKKDADLLSPLKSPRVGLGDVGSPDGKRGLREQIGIARALSQMNAKSSDAIANIQEGDEPPRIKKTESESSLDPSMARGTTIRNKASEALTPTTQRSSLGKPVFEVEEESHIQEESSDEHHQQEVTFAQMDMIASSASKTSISGLASKISGLPEEELAPPPSDPSDRSSVATISKTEVKVYDHKIPVEIESMKNHSENLVVIAVPLNAMLDLCILDLSISNRFGRNNTTNHPAFKAFGTLVVSRNHMDIFEKDGKVYIKDIGSNSGTFKNNDRISMPGEMSADIELTTGDVIQLGKDYAADGGELDEAGRVQSRRRCIQFQIVIVHPGSTPVEAIKSQPVPIQSPVNKNSSIKPHKSISRDHSKLESQTASGFTAKDLATYNSSENIGPAATKVSTPIVPPKPMISTPILGPIQKVFQKTVAEEPKRTLSIFSRKKTDQSSLKGKSKEDLPKEELPPLPTPEPQKEEFKLVHSNSMKSNFIEKTEVFAVALSTSGQKLKKMSVTNGTSQAIEVNLKRKDERRIQVVDLRPNGFGVIDIYDLNPVTAKKGSHPPLPEVTFGVTNGNGVQIGTLNFMSDLKMEVHPTNASKDAPAITITGSFEESRFILIKKASTSREQKKFGECKGRHLVKKGMRETSWLANLEIDQTEVNALHFCAAVLCIVSAHVF